MVSSPSPYSSVLFLIETLVQKVHRSSCNGGDLDARVLRIAFDEAEVGDSTFGGEVFSNGNGSVDTYVFQMLFFK